MQQHRLMHPRLDFWVDVRVRVFDGRWLAVADLAGDHDMGFGLGPSEALDHALASFPRTIRHALVALAESQLART
jgi:hypothetical protein